ncbi:MAG TPA: hypothetical protein VL221_04875 [Bacteroidota bacterium]|nr:hypothetical protein [Bacteroidota bacterium]
MTLRSSGGTKTFPPPGRDQEIWSFDYDSREITLKESDQYPAALLSPHGSDVVTWWNRTVALVDTEHGTLEKEFHISRLISGEAGLRETYVDSFKVSGALSDHNEVFNVVAWDPVRPSTIFVSNFFSDQLTNGSRGLWTYDLDTHTFTLVDALVEQFLSISTDGEYLLYTNNDETCCAGVNYTDNQLILLDLLQHSRVILYDEFVRYGNENKAEDHVPVSAFFSPNNMLFATTIEDFQDRNMLSSAGPRREGVPDSMVGGKHILYSRLGGSTSNEVPDCELVGWADSVHMLMRTFKEEWLPRGRAAGDFGWKQQEGPLQSLDIRDGKVIRVFEKPVRFLQVDWEWD